VLPDISVIWVILAVLLLAVLLDRLLFKPLGRVMREREQAVRSAMDLAQTAAAKAQNATAEFDARLGAARADLYKQMDERRKVAEHYRTDVMAKTRAEVDDSLATAKTTLDTQAAAAKAQLEKDAESLGREIAQKVLGRTAQVLLIAAILAGAPALLSAQAPAADAHAAPAVEHATPAAQPAADHATPQAADHTAQAGEHGAAAAGHEAEGEHGNPILEMAAKLFNFAILAGTLVYFLRSPFNQYLSDRKAQIRSDLVKASEMKAAAATQLEAVDRKLAALPLELDTLRKTGAEEAAAEETRIRELADKERERLLTNMAREINLHGKAAERQLVRHAADRAVAAATTEIERTITPADHSRLVERYVAMVGR
jgi:F-type H+-transporting ATPase subunit b